MQLGCVVPGCATLVCNSDKEVGGLVRHLQKEVFMSEDSSKQIKQEHTKQEQSKQVKDARPVMLKQVEMKEDGRILYYYNFSDSSENQSSEQRLVNSEGAQK
jgi:hypothetical protein